MHIEASLLLKKIIASDIFRAVCEPDQVGLLDLHLLRFASPPFLSAFLSCLFTSGPGFGFN